MFQAKPKYDVAKVEESAAMWSCALPSYFVGASFAVMSCTRIKPLIHLEPRSERYPWTVIYLFAGFMIPSCGIFSHRGYTKDGIGHGLQHRN